MIKQFIEYLKKNNISKDDTLKLLKEESNLNNDEKNIIFAYCFPRQLLDRELPIRIKTYREKSGYSHLNVDPHEVALIIEAGQTEQYKRYIKHLMHSFDNPSKVHSISNSSNIEEELKCGICDNKVLCYESWNSFIENGGEDNSKEFLALGSTESGIVLCKHCLVQLINAIENINIIDPGFLDWTRRM